LKASRKKPLEREITPKGSIFSRARSPEADLIILFLSAGPVVAMDPNLVVVMPGPMPPNPAPVISAGPVALAIQVIRPIANFDVDTKRSGG
jgi:hypothetical protein